MDDPADAEHGQGDPVAVLLVEPLPIRDGPRGGTSGYMVPCSGCGHMFRVAARTLRDLRAQGRLPLCGRCRQPSTPIRVTDRELDYWRSRFTEREIVWMAESLFGPRDSWATAGRREDVALAASAARRSGR